MIVRDFLLMNSVNDNFKETFTTIESLKFVNKFVYTILVFYIK